MTFQEELRAIATLQKQLASLQAALLEREHAEKDVTNRDPGNLVMAIEWYRIKWGDVRGAFAALDRNQDP